MSDTNPNPNPNPSYKTDPLNPYPLTYSIQHFDKFNELLPPAQNALLALSHKFQTSHGSHFLSPDELSEQLGGSAATWRQFLTMKPVKDYVEKMVEEDTLILNRQAIYKQAQKAVNTGDNQAAKYLAQLSEMHAAQSNQQHVILHYVPRPEAITASVPDAD